MSPDEALAGTRPHLSVCRWSLLVAWLVSVLSGPCVAVAAAQAAIEPSSSTLPYRVVRWTTAEGLPQNTVNDMVVLPDGELWLATFGGLARFDGHTFKVLDIATDEGLPANSIVSLERTGSDSLLFLTQDGHLGQVVAGRASLLVSSPSAAIEMMQLIAPPGGRIFARSTDGRSWHTDGRQAWQQHEAHDIQLLAADVNGVVWGASRRELKRLDDGRRATALSLAGGPQVLAGRSGGGLWLGIAKRLLKVEEGRLADIEVTPPLPGPITVLTGSTDDLLWVAVSGEVFRLDRQRYGGYRSTRLPVRVPEPFPIRALLEDDRGSLWIGTVGWGLYRLNRHPGYRLGVGLGAIGSLVSDGAGGAFVTGGCGNLYRIELSNEVHPIPHGVRNPPCQIALATNAAGGVWARAGSALLRLGPTVEDARTITDRLPHEEGAIAATAHGRVWVVSRGGTVQLVTSEGGIERTVSLDGPLFSASLDAEGNLWVGGDGQVFVIQEHEVHRFGIKERVPRGHVRDILVERDGTAWIATYGGGLGRLRHGRVSRVTAQSGLPDNSLSRLQPDGQNRLWMATNRGIAVVDWNALHDAADREGVIEPAILGTERGIPEANFGSPAGFLDTNGRLWFGTIDGVVVIEASAFPFHRRPPVVRIEEVRADDQALALASAVTVPALSARIRIGFTTFELLYPERVRFRFRVEGTDADWVDTGSSRTVDWTPSGPGRHRFMVEARNEDGVWSTVPAGIDLDVLPAWWQTTTFKIAVGGALLVAVVLAMRVRIRALEVFHFRQLQLLEEGRQAEERASGLRLQLERVSRVALAGELAASIAHEVRQPIGAIVNNAEAGKRHLTQYLTNPVELEQLFGDIIADGLRASEVVQSLRGFLRQDNLDDTAIDLSALVRDTLPLVRRELEDLRIHVQLSLPGGLPTVEGNRVQLGQIIVNLVLNACEALSAVEETRRLLIATTAEDGSVQLSVHDNGPGLASEVAERVFDPFVTTKADGLGVGLTICRSIAERHGGRLVASAARGGGLVMTLTLPATRPTAVQP